MPKTFPSKATMRAHAPFSRPRRNGLRMRIGKQRPMSLAAQPHSKQTKLRPQRSPLNAEGLAMVGESKRLGWLNFDLLEIFRYGGDDRVLRDLTDRQLRDSGIDLSQAGRGRAASCRIATIANLEALR